MALRDAACDVSLVDSSEPSCSPLQASVLIAVVWMQDDRRKSIIDHSGILSNRDAANGFVSSHQNYGVK